MPVAHIYADGVLQDAMPLGAKVYGKFPKRLGQISAASGGESGIERSCESGAVGDGSDSAREDNSGNHTDHVSDACTDTYTFY